MSVKRFATCLAAIAAIAPGIAQAKEAPCLTPAEFSSLAAYSLPNVIQGTKARCAQTLGPESFLRTEGDRLSAAYGARKSLAWPSAKAAFIRMSAGSNEQANSVLKELPDESLKPMLDLVIEGMVSQQISLKECRTLDRFVRLLAPLPPENMAELITLVVIQAGKSKKEGDAAARKLTVCES